MFPLIEPLLHLGPQSHSQIIASPATSLIGKIYFLFMENRERIVEGLLHLPSTHTKPFPTYSLCSIFL